MRILKSMRFKFSIVAFLFVFSVVLFAKPPVIHSFKANRYEGFNPMSVKFTVNASDPEGDTLFYTFHIVDEDGFQTDVISETNSIVYTFSSYGNYTVRVSVFGSHNESTESDALSIKVLNSNSPITLSVLTSRQLADILGENFGQVGVKTNFFNDKDYNVNLHIKGYNNGRLVFDRNETILPHATFTISEHYLVHPTTDVVVNLTAHIPVFTSVFTPEGLARVWYRYDNTIQMYVPYIDGNTTFRKTYVQISNPYVKPVGFTIFNKITELPQDYTILLNAGSFINPSQIDGLYWGFIRDEIINTVNFVEEKTLNGIAMSIDYDKKLGFYELKREGSKKLYVPFIPHADNYNDLVLLNTGDRESDVSIKFFDDHGIFTGEYKTTIPAGERVKLYLETIIEDLGIRADYAVINSIQPLIGVNEVRLAFGGEYAYALPHYEDCKGYFPVVLSDDYYWSVISLINPNDEEIKITFNLYTASGKFKTSKTISVPANGMLKSYIRNIFNDDELNSGDSIVITSVKPISGISLQGEYSLERLSALPIF